LSIYKTRVFNRWASKEGLTDSALCHAVHEMQEGLFDADLGGGLFKKRVAKQGQGKRGGYRTLLATNRGDKWFFLFGFPKNERDNIGKDDERALKVLAEQSLSYAPAAISKLMSAGELFEVICNET